MLKFKFIKVNDKQPTIVLVPGWLCSVESSYNKLTEIIKKKYNVFLFDPIGVGMNKECKNTELANVKAQATCLVKLLMKINIKNLILIGHSLGAIVVLIANKILEEKDRVKKIILLDPADRCFMMTAYYGFYSTNEKRNFVKNMIADFPPNVYKDSSKVKIDVVEEIFKKLPEYLLSKNIRKCFVPNLIVIVRKGRQHNFFGIDKNKIITSNTENHFIQLYDTENIARIISYQTNH